MLACPDARGSWATIYHLERFGNEDRAGSGKHGVGQAINALHELLPPDLAATEEAKRLYEFGCVTEMDIVQLIYRPLAPQGAQKDYEFSRARMQVRWQQGFSDACTTLRASPWLAPMPKELGVRVFDVMHDILVGKRKPAGADAHSTSRARPLR
jgi:NTE family protein